METYKLGSPRSRDIAGAPSAHDFRPISRDSAVPMNLITFPRLSFLKPASGLLNLRLALASGGTDNGCCQSCRHECVRRNDIGRSASGVEPACLLCSLRPLCTRSRTGRTIHRHRDQKLLDRARRQARSNAAKADLKRRQHLIERSFADAANRNGLKRARWRGLWKQSIQDLLIATVQNLRKLVKKALQTRLVDVNYLTDLLFLLRTWLRALIGFYNPIPSI
jgi:hypothetical protein